MVLTIEETVVIRASCHTGIHMHNTRAQKEWANVWEIKPREIESRYMHTRAWEPDFDAVEAVLTKTISNCVLVWPNEESPRLGQVFMKTLGKTKPTELRAAERALTQHYYGLSYWCTGWQRKPVNQHARRVEYEFLFPPEMPHLAPERQRYQWPWLQLMQRNLFPQLEEIQTDSVSRHATSEGKPIVRFSLDFLSRQHGMEHFVPTRRALELLADVLSIQLQRPIYGVSS